jgi:hypothetical protein
MAALSPDQRESRARHVRYDLADPLLRFWFRFVFPNDVVGLRDDGWTDLGECKWGPVRSPRTVEQELEDEVKAFPNPRNATLGRRIFTRQERPAGQPEGARWHSLDELYA